MRPILLTPGPVSLSDAVRKAAVSSDLCHREPEYRVLQGHVRDALLAVYGCHAGDWAAVPVGGSEAAALEALLSSLLPREARLLVLSNGPAGERLGRIAAIHGIAHETTAGDWTGEIDFGRVESMLAGGGFSHVAAAHHETATGRLNDAARLAGLCEQHGAQLLLDTGDSFGAEEIPFESPVLAGCSAGSGKCLHGIPGLGFAVVRRAALGAGAKPPRSLYLDLSLWLAEQDAGGTPFMPPVNALLALEAALSELERHGGWRGRRAYYLDMAWQIRQALGRFGVEPMLMDSESSCALTAYRIPEGLRFEQIHGGLKQWGFVVCAGHQGLDTGTFRISTMGDITRYDIERLLAAIETVFKR